MYEAEFFARIDVKISEIDFFRWLPESQDEALTVRLPQYGMSLYVWVPPEKPFVFKWPTEADIVACSWLRVLVTVEHISDGVRSEFSTYNAGDIPEGPVAEFLGTLYQTVLQMVQRICLFVRDELGQFTAQPLERTRDEGWYAEVRAKGSLDGENWKRLRPPDGPLVTLFFWQEERMITPTAWRRLEGFLNSDDDTELTRHLTANAKAYAFEGDYRSAVIDAAIALEREAGFTVQDFLQERSLPTRRITGKESSLTLLVTVWLPLVHPDIESDLLDAAKKVVDCRHEIMHPGRRRVTEEFREYIQKTVQLVQQLQDRRVAAPENK